MHLIQKDNINIGTSDFLRMQTIGYGNMGSTIVQACNSYIKTELGGKGSVTVLDNKDITQKIQALEFVEQGIDTQATLIILAIKPQSLGTLDLSCYDASSTLVSVLAGTSLDKISQIQSFDTMVRCMPNLLMNVGASNTGWYQEGESSEAEHMKQIFTHTGSLSIYQKEEQLHDHTAMYASGIAYMPMMMHLFSEGAKKLNLGVSQEQVQKDIAMMVQGTMKYMQQEDVDIEQFIKQVMSPGGTTQAFRERLQQLGGQAIFTESLVASKQRSEELSG